MSEENTGSYWEKKRNQWVLGTGCVKCHNETHCFICYLNKTKGQREKRKRMRKKKRKRRKRGREGRKEKREGRRWAGRHLGN